MGTKPLSIPGVMFSISKSEVINKDTSALLQLWEALERMTVQLRSLYCVEITIDGYDNDARRLCEIPEVSEWAKKVLSDHPGLFCWFAPGTMLRFLIWIMPDLHKHLPDGNTRVSFDKTTIADFWEGELTGASASLSIKKVPREYAVKILEEMNSNLDKAFEGHTLGKDYALHHP